MTTPRRPYAHWDILERLFDAPAEWRTRAACRNMQPNLFFPPRGDWRGIRTAQQVCADCPVREQCEDYAVTTCQMTGIWGGTTERERRRIRVRRANADG